MFPRMRIEQEQISRCDEPTMALRRNPQRECRTEKTRPPVTTIKTEAITIMSSKITQSERGGKERHGRCRKTSLGTTKIRQLNARALQDPRILINPPFPFFQLPREIRDQVYSYLVVPQRSHRAPVIEAATILKDRKKRVTTQTARERLNRQRVSSGIRPVCARTTISEPIVHLNLLRVSHRMYCEVSDYLYSSNRFAVSLCKLPSTAIEIPDGWDLSRVKRLQLELQLKDSPRMNSYIDWTPFFSKFSALRVLHILPTFHPRYYDWAHTELCDWRTTHYVHKAFFRELLAAIPSHVDLRLGSSLDLTDEMELQGRIPVSRTLIVDMYAELGMRKA
ncbi:uncharacterized protein K460DRAFT_179570 [Cucurbitaria berberidis CBS 394.84]|uniref:DUF7730 domain-containing protein n=1 Tax=Cucurbitaria berberidis CBS 394.84 TaxID=1168544 RepID=A0A9P4GAE2_9PLEO|nr:uncharacterized protein K460DRAFT_179570 [Cucurbitaria berberidis CBS 394.84]KAF1842143.1 hypothetical protein K460DRAFT_179570 [Cucurbitaria berberidis CBS 394.84]